jgi:hypothetical protein
MRSLSADDLSVGLRVLYAGPMSSDDVLDPDRRRMGHVLMPHHPGLVREAESEHHVVVAFRGLEDEPISWGVGFGCGEQTGVYPGLLLPDADEWERAVAGGWWAGQ